MAFSVSKLKKTNRWRFGFYSKKMKDRGYPATKWFTFNANDFRKSDVEDIRTAWIKLYELGEWNPWTDPRPAIKKDGEQKGVFLDDDLIEKYKKQAESELAKVSVRIALDNVKLLAKNFPHHRVKEIKGPDLTKLVNSYDTYNSRNTVHWQLTRFFRWLKQKGYIDAVPVIELYSTKHERNHQNRRPITETQLFQMISALRKIRDERLESHIRPDELKTIFERHEDKIMVGFYMGLRLSELLHIRPAWVMESFRLLRIGDLSQWRLKDEFRPKSQKEYDAPIAIPPEVQGIIRKWASRCDSQFDRLFGKKDGWSFQQIVKASAIRAFGEEFGGKFTPHALRHSCATYWLNERRVPVQEVQHLLRHSDIRVTMGYYHSNTDSHYSAFNSSVMKIAK